MAIGMLAVRLVCDPEEAGRHLARLAANYGVDLAEAASAVIATTSRRAADAPDNTRSVFDSARYLASPSLLGSGQPAGPLPTVEPIDDLAGALAKQLADLVGPAAIALLSHEEDGSLQIVGSAALPPDVAAAWQRVAPRVDTLAAVCARTGEQIWLPNLADAQNRHALTVDPGVRWPSRFVLPVGKGGRAVGVIAVLCETAQPFDPPVRRAVTELAAQAGARLSELLLAHPGKAGWIADVQATLDIVPGAVAVNVPVRDGAGNVVDYLVVAASPEAVDIAGRRGRELVGTSTVKAYPSVVGTELWHAYEHVLATGRPREIGPFTYRETADGIDAEGLYTVRANRFGPGLMVSWVRHDDQRRYAGRLAQTERLGNLGWAEWDLRTNTVYWSDGMYPIYERDPADSPYTLEEAGGLVHADDVDRAGKAVVAMLEDGQPMDLVYRIQLPSGAKHVRTMFETSRDRNGRPLKAYGIVQDITAAQNAERDRARLADIEAELAERQRSLQTEHRLVTALQQIILPLPAGTISLPGLRVAVRYEPAEELTRVGGDWYDVVELPSGRTLLAIGDVAGHGITAAATMARLRHAVAALAVTTTDPAELLRYLNHLVCDDPTEPTATVVIARYDPANSSITWAQAGHPPPIVFHNDAAAVLDRPDGMVVGARRDGRYANATTVLDEGDTMLLYTDGLIERRGRFDVDWLAPVLRIVDSAAQDTLDGLLCRLQPANPDDDTCVLALRPAPRQG